MTATCVILDIGGVLEITPETGWVQRWEERLELPLSTVHERMLDMWRAGNIGSISEREVHEQVAVRLGLDDLQSEAFMADLWAEYSGTPNEDLIDYVRGPRGNCGLGILSSPDRSSGGSRPCAAAPRTGSTWSALRARQPGAARRSPQHLPEVRVGVRRLHLPQRLPEPGPHLLQVPGVPADRAVRQPRRGPRQHQPRQHIGLELLRLLRRGRRPDITQVMYGSQRQPEPPHLQPDREPIGHGENASGIPKLRQPANDCRGEDEPPGHGAVDSGPSEQPTGCRTTTPATRPTTAAQPMRGRLPGTRGRMPACGCPWVVRVCRRLHRLGT